MKKLSKTKCTFYILGILILAFGIALTIQSQLGTSPFDALLVGLSKTAGLTVGSWEIIIAFILIFCNSFLKRQRPEFLGLLTSFITGISVDLWLFLLNHLITPELWYSKLVCFGVGLIVMGLGTAIYLHTHFAPIPVDHLTLIIQELTNMSMQFSRTVIYLFFLMSAIIFNGPIGIGTVITLCLGGAILNYFMQIIQSLESHTSLSNQ
ncbi:YitT family protein [Bacillus sp. B190/17]|uniref:YitT family protein n=1 Tax=Bacillus lumedeiriae TaxID=3058829 RepID=A0ABW8IDF5_9BACI